MDVKDQISREISLCIGALNELVFRQGRELTNPHVLQKSRELDELVLHVMRDQRGQKKKQSQ
ncbi:Spo0E family sporulation regulatory protein-aspartic acid phosphatase [Paenibacillus rigui]|uniref:Spo0E family sporulation regulatory protein-aspartic acid phosphatase n=1 Tax=Paenibacillus rigui TaxID=554312 RepID=A0A229UWY6_9BACL|nr:Spo0E family sporulation regulatory protein-aspartic acid phosphatase [Paenibacillus rigui]OXM87863.1 Spo0E family sporulation regulatory protein-aspartic acid phosphatase [Paenibacillus rigui]